MPDPATRSSATFVPADRFVAQLTIVAEDAGLVAGLVVSSDNPTATAAAIDHLLHRLAMPSDVVTMWALHPSEQDGLRDQAYLNERRELGSSAMIHVEEIARPRQRGVVWIDRFHLIARTSTPRVTVRMCGLYLDGRGRIVCMVHDPVVSDQMMRHAHAIATGTNQDWGAPEVTMAARCTIRAGDAPGSIHLRIPPLFVTAARDALADAARHVETW